MNNFDEMKKYKRILVTGPQRSGTTFTAKTIASDLSYRYIDEKEFNWYDRDVFNKFVVMDNVVIQCPTMCRWIHEFSDDCTLIVMMIRPIKDILNSQKRINWNFEETESKNYPYKDLFACEAKYKFWEDVQKNNLINYLELNYSSLSDHPLWVDGEQRKFFSNKQTKKINIL